MIDRYRLDASGNWISKATGSDMGPSLPMLDAADEYGGNAVFRGDGRRPATVGADSQHISRSEDGPAVSLASQSHAALLSYSVSDVVVIGSKEQASRFNAGRRVATMQHFHAVRDGAVGVRPRQAMGLPNDALPLEVSVPLGVAGGYPKAASVGLGLAVVGEPLGQCGLVREARAGQFSRSHDSTPIAVEVRGLPSGANAWWPRNYAIGAV